MAGTHHWISSSPEAPAVCRRCGIVGPGDGSPCPAEPIRDEVLLAEVDGLRREVAELRAENERLRQERDPDDGIRMTTRGKPR